MLLCYYPTSWRRDFQILPGSREKSRRSNSRSMVISLNRLVRPRRPFQTGAVIWITSACRLCCTSHFSQRSDPLSLSMSPLAITRAEADFVVILHGTSGEARDIRPLFGPVRPQPRAIHIGLPQISRASPFCCISEEKVTHDFSWTIG